MTITGMTIDNSAGDTGALGHNTDGFDIGTSTGVTITGANVYNQDDCVAVNSGTVRASFQFNNLVSSFSDLFRISHSPEAHAPVVTVYPSAAWEVVPTTPSALSRSPTTW